MTKRASAHLRSYEIQEMNSTKKSVSRLVELAFKKSSIKKKKLFKILDVGCGRGELLQNLSNKSYYVKGVDIDKNCVRICNANISKNTAIKSNAENFPEKLNEEKFDLIILCHSLEHCENPLKVLQIAKKYSDFIIIALPNPVRPNVIRFSLKRYNYSNPGHVCLWDRSHLTVFLEKRLKMKIVEWETDNVFFHPLSSGILRKIGLKSINENILPKFFPYFSSSLVVLCKTGSR